MRRIGVWEGGVGVGECVSICDGGDWGGVAHFLFRSC